MTPDGTPVAESCPRRCAPVQTEFPPRRESCAPLRWWAHFAEAAIAEISFHCIRGRTGVPGTLRGGFGRCEPDGHPILLWHFCGQHDGCLIIGFSLTWLGRHPEINPAWRFLIPIGFIGAYSTFSTFEWETFIALETGAFLMSALYVTLSVLLGLIAVWLGALLARIAF
jgi:protein CrcB